MKITQLKTTLIALGLLLGSTLPAMAQDGQTRLNAAIQLHQYMQQNELHEAKLQNIRAKTQRETRLNYYGATETQSANPFDGFQLQQHAPNDFDY